MTRTIIALFLLSLVSYTSISAPLQSMNTFPPGCKVTGFSYESDALALNENGEQTFYLIQNRSSRIIKLQREGNKNAFMSPPLLAVIKPSKWAAFACDVANLRFKCYKQEAGNTDQINCMDVLEVCQYPNVQFATSNKGNYWVSINKTRKNVIEEATGKGIFLHW